MKNRIIEISLSVLLLIVFPLIVHSQEKVFGCEVLTTDSSIYEEILSGEHFYFANNFKGPKFLNFEWYPGEVLLENNKVIKKQYFNFHLPTRQLIWYRTSDSSLIVIDKNIIKQLTMFQGGNKPNQVFRKTSFRAYFLVDSSTNYLQVLAEGKLNLFAIRKLTLLVNLNETVRDDTYYLQIGQGDIKPLKPNRWSLYAMLGEDKYVMKKIIRSNHLRVKNEEDMVKALSLFNQQQSIVK